MTLIIILLVILGILLSYCVYIEFYRHKMRKELILNSCRSHWNNFIETVNPQNIQY
jgi:hypothetical protein